MKFKTLPKFDSDYAKLSLEERAKFKAALKVFISACNEFEKSPAGYRWPASLRFEQITATKRIHAITWSFAGPDGRATFHFESVDGEQFTVWRRVGRHAIYKNP